MKTISKIFLVLVYFFFFSGLSAQTAPYPISNFSAPADTICPGQTVQFTDMSLNGPTSWIWTFKGGTPSTSTLQNPVISYNQFGKYDVILQTSNAQGSHVIGTLSYVKVMNCTGINDYLEDSGFFIFPNPAQSFIYVQTRINAPYIISDAIGSVVAKGHITKEEVTQINIEHLTAGIYFFSLQNGQKNKTFKLVKE